MEIKILDQYGVYPMYGVEINNYKELGLDPDKIYNVKKGSEYIKQIAEQLRAKDITVFQGNPNAAIPVADIRSHQYLDGILSVKLDIETDKDLACFYSANATKNSGDYIGVSYDLELTSCELDSVFLVEKKRERIPFAV